MREVIETTNALREARNAQEEKARENDVEATIEIKGNVGAVVGKGGSTVKSIKHQLRCHFSIVATARLSPFVVPQKRLSSARNSSQKP